MKNGSVTVEENVPRVNAAVNAADPRVAVLEDRVRRLEDVVASLQDTRQMEARVIEGLASRVSRGGSNGLRESAGLIIDAGRHLLPAAVGALKEGADAADAQADTAAVSARRPWLLFEVYAELRAMLRMYVDPRYRLGWQGRTLPLLLVAAIATSWVWLPGTSILPGFVSTLYMKIFDLALAFVLCKVVHREVTRYRATSPDLPASLRL